MSRPNDALRRSQMTARVYRLGEELPDPPLPDTTAEERIELLVALSARMAELAGTPATRYTRQEMPFRVIRP